MNLPVANEKKECVNECVNESIKGRLLGAFKVGTVDVRWEEEVHAPCECFRSTNVIHDPCLGDPVG